MSVTLCDRASIRFTHLCFCGKHKKRGHWFCHGCFDRLPRPFQHALLQGGAQAYLDALEQLTALDQPVSPRYLDPRRRRYGGGG